MLNYRHFNLIFTLIFSVGILFKLMIDKLIKLQIWNFKRHPIPYFYVKAVVGA